jgi:sugar-phosphatase
LLIDMDGTVVDSSASVRQVWTGYAEAHGLDPEEVLAFAQGRRPVETLARFAPGDPDPLATSKALQAQEITLNNEVTAVPGALDLWDGIGIRAKDEEQTQEQRPRRAKVALVTSASRSLAAARMAAAGLTMPAVAICAEDISNGKPDAEGYLAAAKALAVPITECLVLEDSPAGIEAALASGAKLIAIGRHAARDAQAAPDACATQTAQADGTDYAGEPDNSAPGVHPSHLATLEDLRGLKARRTASCKIEVIY